MTLKPHHTAISVRNLEASLQFYEQLGFRQVHRFDEEGGSMSIVHLELGGVYLEVFAYALNATKEHASYDYGNNLSEIGVKHIALGAHDIRAALEDFVRKGLADETTKIEASDTGKAWWFFIKDPDGVWVEIIQDERY